MKIRGKLLFGFDTLLEVRRHEKNFLLYKDDASARNFRRGEPLPGADAGKGAGSPVPG